MPITGSREQLLMNNEAGNTRLPGTGSTSRWMSLFRLIRLPNLLIVVLTQFLLRFCILEPLLSEGDLSAISHLSDFLLLVTATLLMAMGGYVINDYFDVRIDRINKPKRLVVDRYISARGAIKLHILLNIIAIAIGFYLAYRIRSFSFGLIFPFISGLLWLYSAKFKCMVFWGNVIVAALSAMVILLVWLFEYYWLRLNPGLFVEVIPQLGIAGGIFIAYALFAFVVSLFREIVKDVEDVEGDASHGCRTIAIVAGIPVARRIVAALVVATMVLLAFCQIFSHQHHFYILFWYISVILQFLSVLLLVKLYRSKEKSDFRLLSNLCKILMLAGILSMVLLHISI